jgi:hypothetical protein
MGEVARQRKVVEELQSVYIYKHRINKHYAKHIFHDYICDYMWLVVIWSIQTHFITIQLQTWL